MKQFEAVIETLQGLGGQATLAELYAEVMKVESCKWGTKTPFASIRRVVQTRPEIFKVRPGLWALRVYKDKLRLTEYSEKRPLSSHAIGNLRGLSTYVPNQDKNRFFVNRPLGSIRTLQALPSFSHDSLVKVSAAIDVTWFNERLMPVCFFEVEHSTDIQNSLLKFFDLQDFNSRMVIVADEHRRAEYQHKIRRRALVDIKDRVNFLDYNALVRQYEEEVFRAGQAFLI